jgi:hypothetical protein
MMFINCYLQHAALGRHRSSIFFPSAAAALQMGALSHYQTSIVR